MTAVANVTNLDHRVFVEFALDTATERNHIRCLELGQEGISAGIVRKRRYQRINRRSRGCRSGREVPEQRAACKVGARELRKIALAAKVSPHDAGRQVQTLPDK